MDIADYKQQHTSHDSDVVSDISHDSHLTFYHVTCFIIRCQLVQVLN